MTEFKATVVENRQVKTLRWTLNFRYRNLRYRVKSNVYKLQRFKKGYSQYDLWNADRYLAGMFANVLEDLTKGYGVPGRFLESGMSVDEAVKFRNEEYFAHAKVLREYATDKYGLINNIDSAQESMDWVAANWMEFWD